MSVQTLLPAVQADWIEILSALFNTCKVSSTAAAILLDAWDLLSAVDGKNELFSAWVLKHWPDILDIDLENLTDAEFAQYGIELIQALFNTSKVERFVAGGFSAQLLKQVTENDLFKNWFNKTWPADTDKGHDPK